MKVGDVVLHTRSGRRMTVELVSGRVATCAYWQDGVLFRRDFHVGWLVPATEAVA